MKKILAILLAAVMALSIAACTTEGNTDATGDAGLALTDTGTGFRVGFARVDITPEEPTPMAGYGNTTQRISQTVQDPLMASCVAITDEAENTVLFFSIDMQRTREELWKPIRQQLSDLTGIPADHIFCTATHTHSAVDQSSGYDTVERYNEKFSGQMLACGIQALNDRKAATMQTGSVETSGLNFIRHYTQLNGSYVGDSFGDWNESPLTGHTSEIDETMHLIRFVRADDKDIVMANWRAHPGLTGGMSYYNISSDFVGPFREAVEAEDGDAYCVYYQGAAGNVNPTSHIAGESAAVGSKDVLNRDHGTQLAGYCLEGLASNMTDVQTGLVQVEQRIVAGEVNHEMEDKLLEAKMVQSYFNQTNDNALTREYAAQFGIRTPYHAGAIISRAGMEETKDMELNAISIGDSVGFVQCPFEMFVATSEQTEEGSPFDMTFFMGYSNAQNTYVPDEWGWTYTCYESDVSWYVRGTAEMIRDQFLNMLGNLHENVA